MKISETPRVPAPMAGSHRHTVTARHSSSIHDFNVQCYRTSKVIDIMGIMDVGYVGLLGSPTLTITRNPI